MVSQTSAQTQATIRTEKIGGEAVKSNLFIHIIGLSLYFYRAAQQIT